MKLCLPAVFRSDKLRLSFYDNLSIFYGSVEFSWRHFRRRT